MTARALRAAALAVLSIVTVLPVFGGEPVLDDEFLLRHSVATGARPWWDAFRSPFLEGRLPGEGTPYYRPLPLLLFRLEHELAGSSMLLAHATNAILHALNTLLLLRLLAGRLPRAGAWLGAALFAVHPIHAESVAWVSGRTDVLALTFLLLTLHLLRDRPWAAAASFLAAVLAKETAILLPLVVLASGPELYGGAPERPLRARLRRAAPLALALAAYAALRLAAFPPAAVEATFDQLAALPSAPGVIGTYLRLLVLPFPLGFQRAIEIDGSPFRPEFLPGYALVAGAAWLFVRRKDARPALLWIVVFLLPVSLFPVLSFEPGVWPFGERFLYIPSAGLAALAGALLPPAKSLWIPLLVAAAGLAAWHASHFRSTAVLVESSIRWFPGAANLWAVRGEVALGRSLSAFFAGDRSGSIAHARAAVSDLEHALAIRPGWYRARRTLAQALGSAEEAARSEALFRELIRENGRDPIPPSNLAFLLNRLGRRDEARECLLEALRRDPGFGPARANLEQLESGR